MTRGWDRQVLEAHLRTVGEPPSRGGAEGVRLSGTAETTGRNRLSALILPLRTNRGLEGTGDAQLWRCTPGDLG